MADHRVNGSITKGGEAKDEISKARGVNERLEKDVTLPVTPSAYPSYIQLLLDHGDEEDAFGESALWVSAQDDTDAPSTGSEDPSPVNLIDGSGVSASQTDGAKQPIFRDTYWEFDGNDYWEVSGLPATLPGITIVAVCSRPRPGHSPLRPGHAVHVDYLREPLPGRGRSAVDGKRGRLLRQRQAPRPGINARASSQRSSASLSTAARSP